MEKAMMILLFDFMRGVIVSHFLAGQLCLSEKEKLIFALGVGLLVTTQRRLRDPTIGRLLSSSASADDPTTIPSWKSNGTVELIDSGQKQGGMILIVPQGSHAVRLGNDAEISQEVSGVEKGLVYSVMFAVARIQLEHIIHQVHTFFHDYLELPVKKNIPIFLVDANGMGEHARIPYSQGLTLFDDKAKIKSVKRCVKRGPVLEVETTTKEAKRDKVVAILLLLGLPKPILGATLAHEMGHALIRLQDWTFILESKLEEGICEAIAYEWLKHIVTNYDPIPYTQKGAKIAERVRIQEMSRIERGGHAAEFREAHRAIKKYGLKRTLKRVGRSRSIPE
ncbi:hypothetical protein RHGRI_000334 [Rhododendron griersonianum]|uniref:Peptidase M48 domain-containing protein n=1 Tax=Rhododendron griersonianum TaxID=479676 RepID=A0AAV6LJA1_9ERIC|nr:hypothetical protein RHGRI_000334 [Rhododendron griersonianum]